MKWPENIGIKLNINNNTKTLIIDNTDILNSNKFKLYLSKSGRTIHFTLSLDEIMEYSRDKNFNGILIIKNKENIPNYILDRFEIKTFDYKDIPLNIDYNLYSKLNKDDIILILDYLYMKSNHKITQDNLSKVIHNAEIESKKKVLTSVHSKITFLLKKPVEEINYNDLLNIGELWGKLIYLDYILDTEYSLNLSHDMDNFSKSYILSGKFKNVFYETFQNIKSVDKILPYIKNEKEKDNIKIALICFDCMGVAEWQLFKNYLKEFDFNERYIFSLIPSITSISRGAIYSASNTESYSKKINEKNSFNKFFKNITIKHFRENDIA